MESCVLGTYVVLQPFTYPWTAAWELLASHAMNAGDSVCKCPITGSQWRYNGPNERGQEFFHPLHPLTKQPEYVFLTLHPEVYL